jgi:hypothetical protein
MAGAQKWIVLGPAGESMNLRIALFDTAEVAAVAIFLNKRKIQRKEKS